MALQTFSDWSNWLSFLSAEESVISEYATYLVQADITEEDLSELNHSLLLEMNITKIGHRTKILKHAKTAQSLSPSSTKVMKSDIKLPTIAMNISPSVFRKFIMDWEIYKSEHQVVGSK